METFDSINVSPRLGATRSVRGQLRRPWAPAEGREAKGDKKTPVLAAESTGVLMQSLGSERQRTIVA